MIASSSKAKVPGISIDNSEASPPLLSGGNQLLRKDSRDLSSSLRPKIQEVRFGIDEYYRCLHQQLCLAELDTDPRAKAFALSASLAKKIRILNDALAKNPEQSDEIVQLANELLSVSDGAIKEDALKMMLTQSPTSGNVDAINSHVLNYHDANLIELALQELVRHLHGGEAIKVHQYLQQTLETGSLLVRQAIAENIGAFLNQGSVGFYEKLVRDSRLSQKVREDLQSSIEEWRLSDSGG